MMIIMNMKKRIIPLAVGCIMIMQSLSAFAYTDISMKTIREKQLEFASQYEYHKGDFDKLFDLYPGIIYTSGIEYTKDGKTYECPAIYMDEHAKLIEDYDLNEIKAKYVINNQSDNLDDKCVLHNSRMLIPVDTFKEVGCELNTDMTTYVTTISKDGVIIEILPNLVGMRKNQANGFYVPLEACARIIDNTLYVPVRAIANEFGIKIQWNSATGTAYLGK